MHIRLSDIDSVNMDETGNVKVNLPHHRDIVIPLEPKDAKKLVDKLNQLIPIEKEKELERVMRQEKLQKIVNEKRMLEKEEVMAPVGGAQFLIPQPPGVLEEEKID